MHFQRRSQRVCTLFCDTAQAAVPLLMPLLPAVLAELGAPACVVLTFALQTAAVPMNSLMDSAPKPQLLQNARSSQSLSVRSQRQTILNVTQPVGALDIAVHTVASHQVVM